MERDTYTKQEWKNLPSEETPVTAERLSHIESGIKMAMDNRALKEKYCDQSIRLSFGNEEKTPPGITSFEMGYMAKATADFSVSIGNLSEATEQNAVSIGSNTKANHSKSFVTGLFTKSSRAGQIVGGMYNADDPNAVVIIGDGFGENDRKNIHTIDYHGNAYYKGDVANDKYSLNALGEKMDSMDDNTTDVTESSIISVVGQKLEITVPLNLIMQAYGSYIAGGEFIGIVQLENIPPMLFNLQISAVRSGDVKGIAMLTNLVPSTTATYGYKFSGSIYFLFPGYSDPRVKAVFDLGRNITVQGSKIYRTKGSAIDFTISELMVENLSYDETIEILNSTESGISSKIPNIYAIRDWCNLMINPTEGA